jgi:hypothetical protein
MVPACLSLDTMRTRTNAPGVSAPDPVYSPRTTLLAGAAVVLTVLIALVVAAYPFVALGALALAAVARPIVRRVAATRTRRRQTGRARRVRLPGTDRSVEL